MKNPARGAEGRWEETGRIQPHPPREGAASAYYAAYRAVYGNDIGETQKPPPYPATVSIMKLKHL
jgi:hypothetical protein